MHKIIWRSYEFKNPMEIHNWPSCVHAHHWILGNLASTMTSMRAYERLDTLQCWQKRIWCSWPPLRTRFGWDGFSRFEGGIFRLIQIMSVSWKIRLLGLGGSHGWHGAGMFFWGRRDLSVWRHLMTDRNSDKPTGALRNMQIDWHHDVLTSWLFAAFFSCPRITLGPW